MKRLNAVCLILFGASCMSFVGLCMRMIQNADGFQIMSYRSVGMAMIILLVCCLRRKVLPIKFLKSLDFDDLIMGMAFSLAFFTYVFSMLNTSVASTLFLLSVTPILAAIIGWLWIGEKPHKLTWISMFIALIGVFIMIGDGYQSGYNFGNFLAVLSALFFATALVIARRSKKNDVLGGTFLGAFFACLFGFITAIIFGRGIDVSLFDLNLSLFMGAFTIGIGIAFVTWATPFLPAAEVSLLVLVESILGPIWVWIFINEPMTFLEITGGLIVIFAVAQMIILNKQLDNQN